MPPINGLPSAIRIPPYVFILIPVLLIYYVNAAKL